jgi:hypothetical protein
MQDMKRSHSALQRPGQRLITRSAVRVWDLWPRRFLDTEKPVAEGSGSLPYSGTPLQVAESPGFLHAGGWNTINRRTRG